MEQQRSINNKPLRAVAVAVVVTIFRIRHSTLSTHSFLIYSADSMAMETNDINNSAIIIVVPRSQYNENELTTPILGYPIKRGRGRDTYHPTKMNDHDDGNPQRIWNSNDESTINYLYHSQYVVSILSTYRTGSYMKFKCIFGIPFPSIFDVLAICTALSLPDLT